MNRLLFAAFGLLFLLITLPLQEGYTQFIDPLIDSPGRTIGSDFNGDGIHDFIVGADGNDDGTGTEAGAVYIFFGATNLSSPKALGAGQSADVTILGKGDKDYLGRSVSSAGDINGDGIDDIIMGAHRNNDGGTNDEGAAYIIFGASDLSGTKNLGGGASADVTILGKSATVRLGRGVSSAGDMNGDGIDDIIVGAYLNGTGGTAYIFFGAGDISGTKRLGGGESADVTILGKGVSDRFGFSVSGAGDVNGDGFDDIISGAHFNDDGGTDDEGAAYIIFGASDLSGTKDLGGLESADLTILGKGVNDYLGESVSGAGDVNGDGFDDVIVGTRFNNDGGTDDEGAAYVFFGASNLSGTRALAGGQSADLTILGKAANDYLGNSVSGAGDVNDDGFDDIFVGAYRNDDGAIPNGGVAYIFFGSATLSGTKALGGGQSADVTLLGKGASNLFGNSVSGVGDVNGSGIADLIVGVNGNNDQDINAGATYIFYGSTSLSGTIDTGNAEEDVRITGKVTGDFLGHSAGGGRSNPGP